MSQQNKSLLASKIIDIDKSVIYRRLKGSNTPLDILLDWHVLHKILQTETDFSQWIRSIIQEYRYVQGEDYFLEGNQYAYITLDMAKEICLLNKSEAGMSLRRTLITLTSTIN